MNSSYRRITICTSCRHEGTECRPGHEPIEHLRQATELAAPAAIMAIEETEVQAS